MLHRNVAALHVHFPNAFLTLWISLGNTFVDCNDDSVVGTMKAGEHG